MNLDNFIATCFLLLCLSHTALASEESLSKDFAACMDSSGGVTVDMMNCIGDETKRQDVLLNSAYKHIMKKLSPSRKKQLQEVQRVWIKYRELNCNFYTNPDGGTLSMVNANSCLMSATAARAKELDSFSE